jgi:hypothetical protein
MEEVFYSEYQPSKRAPSAPVASNVVVATESAERIVRGYHEAHWYVDVLLITRVVVAPGADLGVLETARENVIVI